MSDGRAGTWRDDAPVIAIIGVAHAGSHFCHLILPPLFSFIVLDIELSYVQLGLVMSVFFGTSGLLQVIAGFCVDRLGATRILVAGLVALGSGALLAATADSFAHMILAGIFLGIGNSVFHPADYAILGHHVSSGRLGRAFSVHTIGGSIGWMLAPPLMTFLALAYDWRIALVVASLIVFAVALSILLLHSRLAIPGQPPSQSKRLDLSFLRELAILMCFLFFVLQAYVVIALQSFLPIALNEIYTIDLATAALLLSTFLLGSTIGTLIGGFAADARIGQQTAIFAGYGVSAFCLFLLGLMALPVIVQFALLAVAGAGAGFTTPSRDLLIRAVAGPKRIGRVFGVVYSGLDLGGTLAPYATALLFSAGYAHLFLPLMAVMTVLTIATVWGARSDQTSEVI